MLPVLVTLAGISGCASGAAVLGHTPAPGHHRVRQTVRSQAEEQVRRPLLLGYSVQHRPIIAIEMGDPDSPAHTVIVGCIHGNEPAGIAIAKALAARPVPAEADLWVITDLNPDGVAAGTRSNAHGVDLNRNFPYRWRDDVPPSNGYYPGPRPASEPETRAVMAFAQRIRPDLSIWYHQPWGAVLACRGRPPIAAEYAKLVGMRTSCRGKGLHGTAITWEMHAFPGSTAFVVEMPPGKISGASADRQARAALTVAEGR